MLNLRSSKIFRENLLPFPRRVLEKHEEENRGKRESVDHCCQLERVYQIPFSCIKDQPWRFSESNYQDSRLRFTIEIKSIEGWFYRKCISRFKRVIRTSQRAETLRTLSENLRQHGHRTICRKRYLNKKQRWCVVLKISIKSDRYQSQWCRLQQIYQFRR